MEKDYFIRVYNKQWVRKQWEISAEFTEGDFKGKKVRIYVESALEKIMHRRHVYLIRIKYVGKHHINISDDPVES